MEHFYLQFFPVNGDIVISVRSTLLMLNPHDMKSLMDDSAFAGTTFVSCLGSFQVNAVNPMTWSIVTQGGAAARLLVVYHHPVLVRGGGGAELGAGNLLNIIETKGDCPSFCLIKVTTKYLIRVIQIQTYYSYLRM